MLVLPMMTLVNGLPTDLNLLVALEVLLAERHVTRAARRLAITQSAASQRLRRLRAHFDDPLLVDARPLMALTPRAAALAGPLRSALAALGAALATGAPFDPRTSRRRFTLIGNDLVEMLALPLLLAHLRPEAPHVSLEMAAPGPSMAERLGAGGADVAFVTSVQAQPSLRQRKILDDPFVVLMRASHPLASRPLTLRRYTEASHVLITPQGAPGSLVDDALASLGHRRHVVQTVRHFASVPFLVAANDVIVTCPRSLARAAQAPWPLIVREAPLELPSTTICAIWHERVHHDPGHTWLRGLMDRVFAKWVGDEEPRRRRPR
jgi:DNA-binding transcriptional LysR family regulator